MGCVESGGESVTSATLLVYTWSHGNTKRLLWPRRTFYFQLLFDGSRSTNFPVDNLLQDIDNLLYMMISCVLSYGTPLLLQ